MNVKIRKIKSEDTLLLRHKILRPHQSPEELIYHGDHAPETVHFGLFLNELIGIASLYYEPYKDLGPDGWRLRGMAVHLDHQRQGYGESLIQECEQHILSKNGKYLWFNARTSAGGFYKKLGFKIISDEFEIEGIGPHWVMKKDFS